ncbi:hypothetical protein SARC_09948 [Sphaeroforma arctica JP610]|uniref:Uncharacterized protein n=1 Tax=Sphaeroforma arctica JP610 TaxID=667725 RepID=A0A0L0FLG6_9EUKA|nr:hypothetical protein SARC_09948 [Sphaeroforma arctica JP610]KNC77590.1 hypothetical protein SARC_09948 [Sphaeroforma arctica JP610]|eukprot:XP_014151492.1 hypothetical protein SARC_09948 [Sphaeroforma arctica JP610]
MGHPINKRQPVFPNPVLPGFDLFPGDPFGTNVDPTGFPAVGDIAMNNPAVAPGDDDVGALGPLAGVVNNLFGNGNDLPFPELP